MLHWAGLFGYLLPPLTPHPSVGNGDERRVETEGVMFPTAAAAPHEALHEVAAAAYCTRRLPQRHDNDEYCQIKKRNQGDISRIQRES